MAEISVGMRRLVPEEWGMEWGRLKLAGKVRKRFGQFAFFCSHPVEHWRCTNDLVTHKRGRVGLIPFKYLGDYLSLDLTRSARRCVLREHYRLASAAGLISGKDTRLKIWEKAHGFCLPSSCIFLENAHFAPMEGELQLSFYFRTRLFILTFVLAHGHHFSSPHHLIIFMGGLQGRAHARNEVREASKLNNEISPATMLLIAARALAHVVGAKELMAVGMRHQISVSYAAPRMTLDYERFWLEGGGVRGDSVYHVPVHPEHRPLEETTRSHRARTRRKREARAALMSEMIENLSRSISAPS